MQLQPFLLTYLMLELMWIQLRSNVVAYMPCIDTAHIVFTGCILYLRLCLMQFSEFTRVLQGYILEEKMKQQSVSDKLYLQPDISHWYASIYELASYYVQCCNCITIFCMQIPKLGSKWIWLKFSLMALSLDCFCRFCCIAIFLVEI